MARNTDLVKCYQLRKDGYTVVVVIPKIIRNELGIIAGDKFLVSYDEQKRMIFQKVD